MINVLFISHLAFLIEEDTDLQRTAAISDHLIKTLTGFLVKNDLDDGSYALMREVCIMGGMIWACTDQGEGASFCLLLHVEFVFFHSFPRGN